MSDAAPGEGINGPELTPAALAACVGTTLGRSDWFTVTQARIDAFADVTEDWQFIHTDPARASDTPFGGTVAHGYLTLSMLSAMAYQVLPRVAGMTASVNYGFDRIRFLAPVPAGAQLRGRFDLAGLEEKGDGRLLARLGVVIEIEGGDSPALSADWLVMYFL